MSEEFLPPERIGFVGLGNMGAPMARHLVAGGYRVMAADADRATLERFCGSASCEPARTLSDLGRSCRLVITMLPDGAAVRQVLLGEQGVAAGLVPGSVVLDMSSAEPLGTRELGRTLAAAGVSLVDAPVSGGVKRAVEGTLAVMAGGDRALQAGTGEARTGLRERRVRIGTCGEGAQQLPVGGGPGGHGGGDACR